MVTFDFEIDQASLDKDRAHRAKMCSLDVAVLTQNFFWMPVKLVVGDITIFQADTGIFDLAYSLDTVKELPRHRLANLYPTSFTLTLRLRGEEVEVEVLGGWHVGKAPYREFLQACEAFADKVRDFLVTEFPELRDHPQVGAWFRGEE